jgi:hypothetical protein
MDKKAQVTKEKVEEIRTFLDKLPENQEATLTAAQTIAALRRNIEKALKKGWTKEQISTKLKTEFNIDIAPSYFTIALREKKTRTTAAPKQAATETRTQQPSDKSPTTHEPPAQDKKG